MVQIVEQCLPFQNLNLHPMKLLLMPAFLYFLPNRRLFRVISKFESTDGESENVITFLY